MLLGSANGQPPHPKSFQLLPSFEEDRWEGAGYYTWRTNGTSVSLNSGGRVSIRWSAGNELRISFPGAISRSKAQGEVPSVIKTLYYLGPAEASRTGQHFERVRYQGIYPGIDLVFVTKGDRLEYNFEIAPHADPSVIRMHYDGFVVDITRAKDIELFAGNVVIKQRRPVALQNVRGQVRAVRCDYRIGSGHDIGLRLGNYDRTQPLFIDPVLDFSTYLGGSSFDAIYAGATDSQGNLYVTGETSSGSLTNASLAPRSNRDAFVVKLNSAGNQESVVYLGGSAYNSGRGIVLDSSGNIYVTGVTDSPDFPVTNGALLTHAPGSQDAFVAKFSSTFALQYSTFLGGGGADAGLAIGVDSSGAAYVTGQTQSTGFPVSSGAFQKSNAGGASDCFISKLSPDGSALEYSTFLGGSALDVCAGVAVDASGNAYVAGITYSINFPLAGAMQSSLLGTASGFVTKVNATGSALVYSTYLGGSNIDNVAAIVVDSTGAAYVTGDTASIDFPTTAGAFQSQLNGLYNAFVSKLSPAGSTLAYSTYVGGSGSDVGTSIAIDSLGRAIVGGYTSSPNFPTSGAIYSSFQGAFDAFSTVLDPAGATLVFSSYFGGSGDDRGYAVALAQGNQLDLAGMTSSSNFPVSSALQATLSVPPDAFVLQVSYAGGTPTTVSVTPSSGSGLSQTFALQYSDTAGTTSMQQALVLIGPVLSETGSCMLYYNGAANQINVLNDNATAWQPATPGSVITLQNSQCSLNVAATSVTRNGDTLTLNLLLTFSAGYAGAKNIYMWDNDVSGASSGWQTMGTWTVPSGLTVTTVSVTPNSGSGLIQAFALQYSDTAGAASMQQAFVLIGPVLSEPSSCMLLYNAATNQINLLNDNATVWQPATLGSMISLQNNQCSLNVAATSVTRNGATLTLNLPLTFQAGYAGAKNIYMWGSDVSGVNSGWQKMGTWTVPGNLTVTTVSATPNSGSGLIQTFALQYSDTAGAASIQQALVLIGPALSEPNGCMLYYNAAANQINLLNNNATVWQPATPGSTTTLQNSQCSLNVAATSVTRNGVTLTLNLPLTFQAGYAGAKNIYMWGNDLSGANSGWQTMGTWTVP
jgi:hypothetical protein